ncbi:MAG: quinone oxidoreductase [Pigmentiphaga sp.]|nr:quinone oxidoreductase [Pigmentiphaga sp.]
MPYAIQLQEHGGPEVLRWTELATPAPAAHQVVVRNRAVGLNFIDVYYRTGLYPHPLPHGLGLEGAGEVIAVGGEVRHLAVGDRVAYAMGGLGAYAEEHCLEARNVFRLPDDVGFDDGAALALKGLTVRYLLRKTYPVEAGQTILFHAAAGGVGLIACQWAKALGAKLIGTVSNARKAELALANGAWAVIDTSREDIAGRVRELTDGAMVPVVYDSVGRDTWEASLDCLQPRGLMVSFGNASGPVTGVNLGILASKGSLYVTRPTLASYMLTPEMAAEAADDLFSRVRAGDVKASIDQRYALRDAAEAHRALEARKTTGSTVFVLD